MPHLCRARGLWWGPEPKEIVDLTYAERRTIQLARVYVSVKRVFLNRGAAGSRGSAKEVPRYHEKNVVAYPHDPDAIMQIAGVFPAGMAKRLSHSVHRWRCQRSPLRANADGICQSAPRCLLVVGRKWLAMDGSHEVKRPALAFQFGRTFRSVVSCIRQEHLRDITGSARRTCEYGSSHGSFTRTIL